MNLYAQQPNGLPFGGPPSPDFGASFLWIRFLCAKSQVCSKHEPPAPS